MDSFFSKQITVRAALSDDNLAVTCTLSQFYQNVNEFFGLNYNSVYLSIRMVRHANRIPIDYCLDSIKTVNRAVFMELHTLRCVNKPLQRLIQQALQ